ncbi:hypothetical protein VA208B3_33250 [Vibrio alginolyticus]|nr:hypothetical protein VA208B3_33250 [Vibrio alginolyticus]
MTNPQHRTNVVWFEFEEMQREWTLANRPLLAKQCLSVEKHVEIGVEVKIEIQIVRAWGLSDVELPPCYHICYSEHASTCSRSQT